ncbi:antibiotic biosynthesis monooxygenase [Marinomonas rhizomae]|uniref:Quinol monooxygenase YgiN n=1 Tax=Marinomonas rhizomae TaxID=491948 RepID=A0A366J9Z7_9GAMM|nr:putative quinol monooxygenase [Marinomonas rhizomae]RBP83199.1 quinol monooxygenase YgiN [Marinomonas rhizomae]RNF72504.1 antibiotic biosynthesis monooxygenase [Marinomonas rhizomae]
MFTELVLVANITAHPGKGAELKTALEVLLVPTRAEVGCLQYDLHQDNNNAEAFVYFERWSDYDVWQDHMKTDHINVFLESTKDMVADFSVTELHQIG